MAVSRDGFHWLDYVVFAAVLIVSLGIGSFTAIFERKKKVTQEEYLLGNRELKVLPTSLTLCLSFISAILILGSPAEMYTQGTQYWMYVFGIILSLVFSVCLFLPLLYPLKLVSSYKYLELRFDSKATKLMGSVLLISSQVIYMGIAVYSPSTALEAATGFPVWASVLCVGTIATVYTTVGGVKAVIWTSVFQSVIIVGGILAVVIAGSIEVGGMGRVWEINEQWNRIEFFNFDPDPTVRHSFWSLVVGGGIAWTATYGVNQASVQRYCALPTIQKGRATLLWNIPWVLILITLTCLSGVVVFAYFADQGCDPLQNGDIDNSNQVLPYFIMQVLAWPGFPGLFVSTLFAGALSSMSGAMNALAAVTWEDMLKWKYDYLSETKKTMIIRGLVAVYGVAGIAMAFAAQEMGGTVLQASLSFTGSAMAPMLGLFLLGGLFPWANWIGAITGATVGLILPMWISIGAYVADIPSAALPAPTGNCSNFVPGPTEVPRDFTGVEVMYTMSYLWFPPLGTLTTVVLGVAVSFLCELLNKCGVPCNGYTRAADVDPRYLIRIFDWMFCCFPEKWRATCRCGTSQDAEDERMDAAKPSINFDDIEIEVNSEEKKEPMNGTVNPAFVTSEDVSQEVSNRDSISRL